MDFLPVNITDTALNEIKHIMDNKNIPTGYGLRVGMKGGGCGAAGFFLGFDKANEQDQVFQVGQIEVLIDKRHLMYLLDMEVDFEERHDERGFIFNKDS